MPACIRFTLVYSVRRTVSVCSPSVHEYSLMCALRAHRIWTVHVHFVSVYLNMSLRHSMQFASFLECFPIYLNIFIFFFFVRTNADSLEKWCSIHTSSFEPYAIPEQILNPHHWKFHVNSEFVFICSTRAIFILYFFMFPFVLPLSTIRADFVLSKNDWSVYTKKEEKKTAAKCS